MSTTPAAFDPMRCPLCGHPNRCAMETQQRTGIAQAECWCTRIDFSRELLARLPAAARGAACICPACAAAADQPAALPSSRALRKPPVP
jgi:hypothetical protein